MNIIKSLFSSYRDHELNSLAANISFFAILSIIPLLMITTSVAGFVLGGSETLVGEIIESVTSILPKGGNQLARSLNGIIAVKSGLGWTGIFALLFASTLLFSSIEKSLDKVFEAEKRRNYFHSKLIAVLFLFVVAILFFLPTMVHFFETALMHYHIGVPLSAIAKSRFFFGILSMISFIAAVIIIPNHHVQFRFAAAGGVLFAVGLVVAKLVFTWYIAHSFNRYSIVYGSLAVLVVTVLWIYYLANVLLVASEFVAVLQRRYFK